ncbi:hypothetical protein FOZ60_013439 [Perkinsus olseni]|uniref:Uncharacterized protein n=1 Tax=Perkinsus olseni TaxID=32597 RepID=A0A7J6N9D6_PEROL|nr:hypothetical protein FOZ60_013439 [Perkinsus olseni]
MRGPLLTYTLLSKIVDGSTGGKPPTELVSPDSLPAGTYKAVEQNGTICPELPGLTDFEMVVTDGEEGQLVTLAVVAEGERVSMYNAFPVKWYSYGTVYNLSRFGSGTIKGTARCFHVEYPSDAEPFVDGLYRILQQLQKEEAGEKFGSQLIFCYTSLGLTVGIGAKKKGSRWYATRYAFRIHLPGLPTYDYICKVAPSITSRSKGKKKREHVQQELLPRREPRESLTSLPLWDFHENTFEPPPKIGRLEPATAASEGGPDSLRGKRTVTVVDHSYATDAEARKSPPARVFVKYSQILFEDDSGERLRLVGDGLPDRTTSGSSEEQTKRSLGTSGGRGRQTSRKSRNPQHLVPLADMGKYLSIAASKAE